MLTRGVVVTELREEVKRLRRSRVAVILLVYAALVLDNMLLTVVVPIIPDYLYQLEHQQGLRDVYSDGVQPIPTTDEEIPSTSYQRLSPLSARNPRFQKHPSISTLKTSATDIITPPEFSHKIPKDELMSAPSVDLSTKYKPLGMSERRDIFAKLGLQRPQERVNRKTFLNDNLVQLQSEDPGAPRYQTSFSRKETDGIPYKSFRDKDVIHPEAQHYKHVGNSEANFNFLKDTKAERTDGKEKEEHNIRSNESAHQAKKGGSAAKKQAQDDKLIPLRSFPFFPQLSQMGSISSQSAHPKDQHSLESIESQHGEAPQPLRSQGTSKDSLQQEEPATSGYAEGNASASSSTVARLPQDIINENGRVGLLFSSKALVQLLVNPLVGPLTAHVGYSLPLIVGTHNLILSALLFAYAQSYALMFVARSLQGIASSCIAIAGMGIIAECYTEDGERGRVQGLVMGGIALGVLLGYPLGSLLYDFTSSKTPPFLVVAAFTAVLAVVQLAVLDPRPTSESVVISTPLLGLVKDPYILVTAGAIMVSTTAMAVLEPCLPIWLTDTLHPQKWQLGTAFIPDSVGYLVGTSCTAGPAFRLGRWRAAVIAMLLVGLATATVPEARSMLALAGPHLCLGMGVGTVDAALMPLLAAIVDARHVAAYGAVYAIAQAAVALAYFLGPLVGGVVVQKIGFPWLMRGVAIINLCYCPVLLLLSTFDHNTTETQAILMAAPRPKDYTQHITTSVQPRETSLRYQQLFDEEDD
ncbi:synaptic vesicular amine transporter [Procambarus clarkii]|uniref:synaptic vesicular amine transporter n=1 Tax=Procambarus clarkii TaxID=6728 RepID=UPI001E677D5B|nr:synaptic vesicular amine transporter-like [Procambarus clarkii]